LRACRCACNNRTPSDDDLIRLSRELADRSKLASPLAPVYGWFTEGFDTRDLKEAKALLDELA
jgi:predicted ATPase